MKTDLSSNKADYIGITGSVLCLVHCLVTPVLLLTSTALQHSSTLRVGYVSLDYVFIGINCVAVYFATRHYAPVAIKRGLWSFLALFSASLLLEDTAPVFQYTAYLASLGLIVSHLLNLRQHRVRHTHH